MFTAPSSTRTIAGRSFRSPGSASQTDLVLQATGTRPHDTRPAPDSERALPGPRRTPVPLSSATLGECNPVCLACRSRELRGERPRTCHSASPTAPSRRRSPPSVRSPTGCAPSGSRRGRRSRRCPSRPTSCTRRTSICARPRSTTSGRTCSMGRPASATTCATCRAPAGIHVETMSQWLARDPASFRAILEGGSTLPSNDKLAMLARGFWSHGRHVEIAPRTVLVEAPIVLRWPSAAPGRALITRTIVTLGAGASASLVEEQVPCGPDIDCAEGETVPAGLLPRDDGGRPRRRRVARHGLDPGPAREPDRVPAPPCRDRRGRDRSTGRSRSSAAASYDPASTTASRAIAAPSSRSRSCSRAGSSCSTSPRTPATSAATRPATCCRRAHSSIGRARS